MLAGMGEGKFVGDNKGLKKILDEFERNRQKLEDQNNLMERLQDSVRELLPPDGGHTTAVPIRPPQGKVLPELKTSRTQGGASSIPPFGSTSAGTSVMDSARTINQTPQPLPQQPHGPPSGSVTERQIALQSDLKPPIQPHKRSNSGFKGGSKEAIFSTVRQLFSNLI
jgi:hypothetical protein